jgi:hypothetical protein
MAYVIERESNSGTRYTGMYKAVDGSYKSAGTFGSHERAFEVADAEERHAQALLDDTSPADKAKITIEEFFTKRFLPFHAAAPNRRQHYDYTGKTTYCRTSANGASARPAARPSTTC